MSSIKIRIGASVDSSVATSFTNITKAAAHAAAVIKKELAGAHLAVAKSAAQAAAGSEGPYRRVGAAAGDAAAKTKAAGASAASSMGQLATGTAQKFKELQAGLRGLPVDLRVVAKEATKALQQVEREKARTALGLGGGGGGGRGGGRNSRYWYSKSGNWNVRKPTFGTLSSDPIHGIASFGMGAASYLGRAALGVASSIGVDTDFGSMVGKSVADEKTAQQVSNAGYFPGTSGPNGQLVHRGDLMDETRKVGIDTGTERGEVLGGLREFVGKTGDLQLGRDILADMAKLSRATGSNLGDMESSAAEVANALGNVKDKGALINAVMRQVAGQGKLGAVEVRDLSVQMAKLAGSAGKFEGGAAKNIGILSMLAQEAKLGGSATNAAQATTSVARFADVLTQGKEIRALKKAGIQQFTDDSRTVIRDPREIIKDMLSYSKGDLGKISALMPGSVGKKPLEGLAKIYRQAQGTDADKIKTVNEEFDRMAAAMVTEQEVNRAFAASMETTDARVKTLNEQLGAVAEQMSASLLPALMAVAPELLQLGTGAAGALARLLGVDVDADKNARTARARTDLPAALEKQLKEAEGRAPNADEPQFAVRRGTPGSWNSVEDNGNYSETVPTHGSVDPKATEALKKQSGDIAGEIADQEAKLKAYEEEHKAARGSIGGHSLFSKYNKDELAEISKQESHIGELKTLQDTTNRVLAEILQALTDGSVTFKTVPPGGVTPPPGGVMPPVQ